MGIGGIGMGELLIVLVVVLLIFGTKRLNTIGSDLGGAIKGFRNAMADGDRETEAEKSVLAGSAGSEVKRIDAGAVTGTGSQTNHGTSARPESSGPDGSEALPTRR